MVGRRTAATALAAWQDFYQRTDGCLPDLITTDEYPAYPAVIVSTYGVHKEDVELSQAEREDYGWGEWPPVYFPVEIAYATVHKERAQGRVVRVEQRVVFGTEGQVTEALEGGSTAPSVNLSYVERWHGTQRHFNARKARRVYTFSKDLGFHRAVTWLCVVTYNFCWKPRTLRERIRRRPLRYRYRTPAMVEGLAERPWSIAEVLRYPMYRAGSGSRKRKRRRRSRLR